MDADASKIDKESTIQCPDCGGRKIVKNAMCFTECNTCSALGVVGSDGKSLLSMGDAHKYHIHSCRKLQARLEEIKEMTRWLGYPTFQHFLAHAKSVRPVQPPEVYKKNNLGPGGQSYHGD